MAPLQQQYSAPQTYRSGSVTALHALPALHHTIATAVGLVQPLVSFPCSAVFSLPCTCSDCPSCNLLSCCSCKDNPGTSARLPPVPACSQGPAQLLGMAAAAGQGLKITHTCEGERSPMSRMMRRMPQAAAAPPRAAAGCCCRRQPVRGRGGSGRILLSLRPPYMFQSQMNHTTALPPRNRCAFKIRRCAGGSYLNR